MSGFLKFAIGVAVLGCVGLVGLSVMSIVATLVISRSESHRVVPAEEVPALAVDTRDIDRAVRDAINSEPALVHPAEVRWEQPARVQVNVHDPEGRLVHHSFVGLLLALGMLVIIAATIAALFRFIRKGKAMNPSDESALVHELARRAQDLAQRMEALETILLDRTRATR